MDRLLEEETLEEETSENKEITEVGIGMQAILIGVEVGQEISGNFRREDGSTIRSGSRSRASTHRDRIRCFRCRDYDHFAKDYPNMAAAEKDQSEQM